MEIPTPYENYLSLPRGGKGIPYGPSELREDGTQNHGFRPLKGKTEEIASVAEPIDDPELAILITKINLPETGVFSVGCLSSDVDEEQGMRVTGYVEFALNDKKLVNDAIPYFEIFFDFSQRLISQKFDQKVRFNWELLPATFFEADCQGFTCSIVVNTFYHDSREGARQCWSNSLRVLGDHLFEIKDRGFNHIYAT